MSDLEGQEGVAMPAILRLIQRKLFVIVLLFSASAWADAPSVIRMGVPGVGVGNRPVTGGSSAATMHLRGMLEEEFGKEGIRVTWSFLRGAGPAVNEAYANGLVDFSLLGDLPSIIGKAGGLKTRVLAATAIRQNLYLTVPAGSDVRVLKDLRGRKVSLFKGTNNQLAAAKILEKSGLSERDIRAINMDTATAKAALGTGDIDAAFGGSDYLALRDQGLTRLIYTSKGDDPRFLRHCSFVGSQDFIQKYPEHTLRVVKTLVRAAKWMAEQDGNPEVAFQLWTRSGVTFSNYKEDWQNASLKVMSSPLVDPYIISQYNWNIQEAKRFGLIRSTFRFEDWYEPRFLEQALRELGLEGYWKPADENGKIQG
ncbi:MAG TPA: ABC transporter substrate-binding protein [Polyangiaceae bacterium]|nr:ABC transporter substrate-binding protein [Polyangiaceae bacterium]